MDGTRRRGPYAKTAARRAQIGRAAMDLVLERGHPALTTETVAQRAGVTVATVTYHFPTRDDLLVAALDARESGLVDPLQQWGVSTALSAESLQSLIRDASSGRHYVALYAAMSAAAADPAHPAHDWISRHLRTARAAFATTLRELQGRGLAHPEVDPDLFGRKIVAVWDGLQIQWLTDPDFDLADAVTEAFRSLARMDAMEAKRALEALAAEL